MTVPSNVLKNKYQGNNVLTSFAYNFKIFDSSQVLVKKLVGTTVTTLTLNVDYTVTGVGNDTGGNINYPLSGSPLATGEYIIIKPNFQYVQNTKLENQNTFPPKTVENALDLLLMQVKQVAEELERAVQLGDEYDGDASALLADIVAAEAYATAAAGSASTATAQAVIATAQAAIATAAAAGLNIPPATLADALKALRVKSDGSGYELYTVGGGATGVLKDMNIGEGVENDGSSNLRVKLNGSTLNRGASGIKVSDAGITDTQLNTTGVVAGTYTNVTATVTDKGRVTSMSSGSVGLTSVSQGNLNTTTGTISGSASNADSDDYVGWGTRVLLPGGQYGFQMQSRESNNSSDYICVWVMANTGASYASYVTPVILRSGSPSFHSDTIEGQQRYVTSSPPYDHGDGQVASYMFALVDQNGDIKAHYFAEDPPWAYNGPTNTFADFIDPETGKKYRLKRGNPAKASTALDIINGKAELFVPDDRVFDAKIQDKIYLEKVKALRGVSEKTRLSAEINFVRSEVPKIKAKLLQDEYEPITDAIKNADMGIIPHPFGDIPQGYSVVLVDCFDPRIADLMMHQKNGGSEDVVDMIKGYLKIESDFIEGRMGPQGVAHARLRIK